MTKAEIEALAAIAAAVDPQFPASDESSERFALAWTPGVCIAVARLAWQVAE